jgi:hypothetical protein
MHSRFAPGAALRPRPARRAAALAGAALVALAAACGDDDFVAPVDGTTTTARVDTVDTRLPGSASATRWTYVSLANPRTPLALTDEQARTSDAWDVAFSGFSTKVNGGAAGPGNVTVHCLCQNSTLPNAATVVPGLTAAGELADFEAVTATRIPADSAFRADTLPAVTDWFQTGASGARTLPAYTYIVHRPNGQGFAKLQVTAVQNATGATPGRVTFQYATMPGARGVFSATQTATVDVPATGRVAFSFASNGPTTGNDWDLAFQGWRISTNSGSSTPSGTTAGWGAYNATTLLGATSFDAVTQNQVSPTINAFRPDGHGLFGVQPTWLYATGRVAVPTYDVYLLKRGAQVHKLQVVGYSRQTASDATPVPGFVIFRSARLR